jgi:hypothetical protein
MLRRIRARASGDRGSFTVYTVVFTIAVILLLGLIVDGGMAMNARERAEDIAGQAARAAADDIDLTTLRDQGTADIAPGACLPGGPAYDLVSEYAGDVTGHDVDHVLTATVLKCQAGARSVAVTVQIRTRPLVPGVLQGFTETAKATAVPECGITVGVVC